jgi:hypothetical protein
MTDILECADVLTQCVEYTQKLPVKREYSDIRKHLRLTFTEFENLKKTI